MLTFDYYENSKLIWTPKTMRTKTIPLITFMEILKVIFVDYTTKILIDFTKPPSSSLGLIPDNQLCFMKMTVRSIGIHYSGNLLKTLANIMDIYVHEWKRVEWAAGSTSMRRKTIGDMILLSSFLSLSFPLLVRWSLSRCKIRSLARLTVCQQ